MNNCCGQKDTEYVDINKLEVDVPNAATLLLARKNNNLTLVNFNDTGVVIDQSTMKNDINGIGVKDGGIGDAQISQISASKVVGLPNLDNVVTDEDLDNINTNITNLQTSVASKANQSDLTAETTARTSADNTLQSNINLKADLATLQTEITNRTNRDVFNFTYNSTTKELTLLYGDGTSKIVTLPISTETVDGLMSAANVKTLIELVQKMASVESGGLWRGNFNTYEDLIAAYPNLDVSSTNWFVNDFVYVTVSDSQHNDLPSSYIVVVNADNTKTLVFKRNTDTPAGTVPTATNTSLGIVKGSIALGEIFVETDGTLSLNGWDELGSAVAMKANQSDLTTEITNRTNADTTLQNNINLKADITALPTKISQLQNDSGYITSANIPAPTETDPIFTAWKNGTSIVIGNGAEVISSTAIGIGEGAKIGTDFSFPNAIQLGFGTNNTNNSFQVWNYPILINGKIPNERLNEWVGTQSQFEAISTLDPNITYYVIA